MAKMTQESLRAIWVTDGDLQIGLKNDDVRHQLVSEFTEGKYTGLSTLPEGQVLKFISFLTTKYGQPNEYAQEVSAGDFLDDVDNKELDKLPQAEVIEPEVVETLPVKAQSFNVAQTSYENSVASVMMSAEKFNSMLSFASNLVSSGFLPDAIKTPAQCVAIILAGQELGMPPMQSLRSINVIKGKVSLSAELQLARFVQMGGHIKWLQTTNTVAELWLKHPNGQEHTHKFTIEEAKKAGVTNNPTWSKYAPAMLRARCGSAGIRAIAPDIGMQLYDPEELDSINYPSAPSPNTPQSVDTGEPRLADALSDENAGKFAGVLETKNQQHMKLFETWWATNKNNYTPALQKDVEDKIEKFWTLINGGK
jgi:hypothetical protein